MRRVFTIIFVGLILSGCASMVKPELRPQASLGKPIPARLTFQFAGNVDTLSGEIDSLGGCATHTFNYDIRDPFEKALAQTVGQRFSVGPERYDISLYVNSYTATYDHINLLGNILVGYLAGLPEFKVTSSINTVVTVRTPKETLTLPVSATGQAQGTTWRGCDMISSGLAQKAMDDMFVAYVSSFDRTIMPHLRTN